MTSARRAAGVATRGALWALACLTLVPLYFLIANALRPGADYAANPGGFPQSFTLSNFHELLANSPFFHWLLNSLFLTGASTGLTLLIATMAAHALTYFGFRGAGVLTKTIAALMIVPPILLVIPLFVQFSALGLIDSYVGVIIVYTALSLPFAIFMFTRFFAAIPASILDAARIDGARPLRILPTVIIPLAKPAVVTLGVVTAFFAWNDLLVALIFLQSDSRHPLMVGLTTLAGNTTQSDPLIIAGALLSIVPVVALYLATQRYIVRGLYGGSLRG